MELKVLFLQIKNIFHTQAYDAVTNKNIRMRALKTISRLIVSSNVLSFMDFTNDDKTNKLPALQE